MGQELECNLRYQRRTVKGKAWLETDHLLFRGLPQTPDRLKILFKDLTGVKGAAGVLKLEFKGGPAEFELGAAAEKWAHKILHPPSLLDKLGVKPGLTVRLVGDFDAEFRQQLTAGGAEEASPKAKPDLLFFAATQTAQLSKVPKLASALPPAGALWIIYPKGVPAIREVGVIEAGRGAGLKDVKVAGFSAHLTALKFVIPLTNR
jgi:hypothetical protein